MKRWAAGPGIFSLLHLLATITSSAPKRQHKTPRRVPPQQQEETRLLTSKSEKDVREFQKRLHHADLDYAGRLLRLLDAVLEITHGSDDPRTIEERRIHTETMVKGEYREGVGWTWNGHHVPEPKSTSDWYEKRRRVVANGTWNPARKGWEYQGEFFGAWD